MSTVLLTGITGFLAKRVTFDLLAAGHAVRGSLRSSDRAAEVKTALTANGMLPETLDRLEFVTLDLTRDAGWTEAMAGVDAVVHTASPFPLGGNRAPETVIRPAVDGALRALRAAEAAGVTRVVLTSSIEAVMHGHRGEVDEDDWSDLEAKTVSAYTLSKVLAERAAWDFVAAHPDMRLTVINPGLIAGRPMDRHYGSSIRVIERLFAGRDPAMPDIRLPVVDIADASAMHVEALGRDETAGRRYIAADSFLSMPDMAAALKDAFPDRRIATRVAPHWLIRAMALFDGSLRTVTGWQGVPLTLSHARARAEMGQTFTPARDAVVNTARFLADAG